MTKKEAVLECYENASGHIAGDLLLGAIALGAEELCNEKVTLQEVVEILEEAQDKIE